MNVQKKLEILAGAAKYDVSCASSGSRRENRGGRLGNTAPSGICHSFTADGRCGSLLKVLLTNFCIYDCAYCANRSSNDIPRAAFTPAELAALAIDFYRRNFIEGLLLSSGVFRSPDETMEQQNRTVRDLRSRGFNGYIQPGLFEECEEIANDANKAERVWQGLKRHLGSDSRSQVYQAYLTAASEVEILLRQSMEIRPDSGILPAEAAAANTCKFFRGVLRVYRLPTSQVTLSGMVTGGNHMVINPKYRPK